MVGRRGRSGSIASWEGVRCHYAPHRAGPKKRMFSAVGIAKLSAIGLVSSTDTLNTILLKKWQKRVSHTCALLRFDFH